MIMHQTMPVCQQVWRETAKKLNAFHRIRTDTVCGLNAFSLPIGVGRLVFGSVSLRLSMTMGTQEANIIPRAVQPVPINVVYMQDKFNAIPFSPGPAYLTDLFHTTL